MAEGWQVMTYQYLSVSFFRLRVSWYTGLDDNFEILKMK